jgi:putative transposase
MWIVSADRQYARLRRRYASEVTDAELALIAPLLPAAGRGGRKRTTELREVLNAILYLLRTGCSWAMLPEDFPPVGTVYGYFRRFWREGVWSRIQPTLLMAAREQAGEEASPSAGVVDSQSVKTAEAGGPRGYDAGKKVLGRDRHLVSDTLGLPLALSLHPADIQDRDGPARVCRRICHRFPWLRLLLADGGNQGEVAACAAAAEGRRLAEAYERLIERATAMAALAFIQLLARRNAIV